MPDVNLTIDGIAVSVPGGTNVVDAARLAGVSIPVFCYHPRLKPVGMCRMCLVQVGTPKMDPATKQIVMGDDNKPTIAMMPKLQTGCTTPVSEGMVVKTVSAEVQGAQRGVLEFLLTSHPLDCPVCDKGGECPLQNLTMGWGPAVSRFDYDDKAHFKKPIPLGDLITLDRERCILCARCVRFQDEVADDQVLGFDERGRNWQIITRSDPPFDSKFSGNTTDICPVGALTSTDFRFKARVWELQPVPSVCTHCSVGCNTTLDMRNDALMRVMPRENSAVNDIWICDKGRYAQRFMESQERLTKPLIRRDGTLVPASWDEALTLIAKQLNSIKQKYGGSALAGLAYDRLSNEALYTFQRFFREVLGSSHLDHRVGAPADAPLDDAGALWGVGAGTDLMSLGKGTSVLVLGADPEEEAPVYLLRLRAITQRGGSVIVANQRATKLDRSASMQARYRPLNERAFVMGLLQVIASEVGARNLPSKMVGVDALLSEARAASLATLAQQSGVKAETISEIAKNLLAAENVIIMYGAEARSLGASFTNLLGALALVSGHVGKPNNGLLALLPHGNTRGALALGLRPDMAPDYTVVKQAGLAARELWGAVAEGRVKGLYLAGIDPARELSSARTALEKADFVVVQDIFMTETAKLADVVLPAAAFAEEDGTYINAENRVQRSRQIGRWWGESRPDWQIVQDLAQRVLTEAHASEKDLASWNYLMAADVANEIALRVPIFAGITPETLAQTVVPGKWGRQTNEAIYYDGTNYENNEGVGIQIASLFEQRRPEALSVTTTSAQAPLAHDRYPLVAIARRVLYDSDPWMQESLLQKRIPSASVTLHTDDAQRLGVAHGDRVAIRSAAGSLELPAVVTKDEIAPGSVLLIDGLIEAPLSAIQTGARTFVAVEKI